MPRPSVNLDPYQEEITRLVNSNYTNEDICAFLLNTRRDAWGLRTPRAYLPKGTPDEISRNQVVYDLLQLSLDTHEILRLLQKMGIPSSERSLCRIRQKLGVRLRVNDTAERVAQERAIEKILTAEDQIGDIDGYGRRLQQIHLRSQGVFIARDRAYEIYRTINPDAIEDRRSGLQRRRGAYICDGPNAIWHLDGYMKLEPFGIEIYAAIDGYSRYVTWIYIGISARTAAMESIQSNAFLSRLQEDVAEWDPAEYLPPSTLA
ncbi:uncharacterized protein N7458_000143 [Penicillium daleae]|uniref:Integrase core domain-containing protein n=1 Tax=Penicillium daleae TaxID=63821 RepID=A0AAD6G8K5_9EURO|nr:uncharacterized protein N7458_000143 [Penicillium daleae]KAJ5464457.1 hypothetical protein N7458_000143 [Penicillium daleae]